MISRQKRTESRWPKDGVLPPLAWPAFLAWGLLDFVGPNFQGCKGLGLRAQDMGWDDDWTLEGLPLPVVRSTVLLHTGVLTPARHRMAHLAPRGVLITH